MNGPSTLDPVWRWALQGDLRQALQALQSLDIHALSPEEQLLAARLLERFGPAPRWPDPETGSPLMDALLGVYRRYWSEVMRGELSISDGERYLQGELAALLQEQGVTPGGDALQPDLGVLTDALDPVLEAAGFRSIRGVTRPYWELMAWTRQEGRTYEVALPETRTEVQVIFLEGFVSLGWTAFATCERFFSGGWATPRALYCVRDAYDLDSETFSVSYLAHEAQHQVDNRTFPALEQPELEFRAKLAELSLAQDTAQSLLRSFAARGGADRRAPHALANAWVARTLERALGTTDWDTLPAHRINEAARHQLVRYSAALHAAGARTVAQCLPGD